MFHKFLCTSGFFGLLLPIFLLGPLHEATFFTTGQMRVCTLCQHLCSASVKLVSYEWYFLVLSFWSRRRSGELFRQLRFVARAAWMVHLVSTRSSVAYCTTVEFYHITVVEKNENVTTFLLSFSVYMRVCVCLCI